MTSDETKAMALGDLSKRALAAVAAVLCTSTLLLGASATPAAAAIPDRPSVFTSGGATNYGSTGGMPLNSAIVDLVPTPSGNGYWQLAGDGGVFSYGAAPFYGSTGGMRLNSPARAMAASSSGGYWFTAGDGGVFAFGNVGFYGSMGGLPLNKPVVGIYPTPSGHGYWLVATDGGVFAFGDAGFIGSLGGTSIPDPIVSLTPSSSGVGYWLVDRKGRVYAFGTAQHKGNLGDCGAEVTDIASTPSGGGYWILCANGKVTPFGNASGSSNGNASAMGAGIRAVAIASTPSGNGFWISTSGNALAFFDDSLGGNYSLINSARWSTCTEQHWVMITDNAPGGAYDMLDEGFRYINRLTGFHFDSLGTRTYAQWKAGGVPRGTVVVQWVPGLGPAGLGGPTWTNTSFGLRDIGGSVQLNTDVFGQFGVSMDWTNNGMGTIFLHEMGHVLGLGHVNDASQLMNPTTSLVSDFEAGDRQGLRRLNAGNGC